MSPEPLHWNRRDFRKHDRSAPDARLGAGGGPQKWRHQQHDPHAPPPYHHRWYSDFRSTRLLPPGHSHSKQGGCPMYSDDAGQGFMPLGSRVADRNLENEICRPVGSFGDGRYIRSNRGNRSSLSQKHWRNPSWESDAISNSLGEPMTEVNNLKSIEATQSDQSLSRSPSQPIGEKNGGTIDKMTDRGQECEKENCLAPDWEPLKWSCPWVGNVCARNICMGHSTSSKSLGLDSVKVLAEVQPKNATLDHSTSADLACVRSIVPAQSDKTGSRKKPRLGWGEGLAKYEKKKVGGPEEGTSKNEPALSSISTESSSANLPEQSPRVEMFHCASPATPTSVACSFSPGGVDEKSAMEKNSNRGNTNLSCSPSVVSPAHYGGPILDLENLELESIANLSSLIKKLQQPYYSSSSETGYLQTTSINKLLLWKVDTLKALEKTESEIESLETELKSLKSEPEICCSHPAGPRSSHIVSPREATVMDAPVGLEGEHVLSTDEDIDNPGCAASKFVGVLPAMFLSEKAEFSEGARNVDVDNSGGLDEKCLKKVCSSQESPGYVNNLVPNRNSSLDDFVGSSKVYCNVDNLCSSILSSNRDAARRASQQLNKLLPKQCLFDIKSIVSSSQRKSSLVRERFLKRNQVIQFKEKVLTLKFKVFQHFWKEGRLVSIRRLQRKTQNKFDPGRNVQKRNRTQVSFYVGGPRAVRADEVIQFVNDLLSELAFKPYRNTLKMPALVLDKQVRMSRFISNNGLVEDPCVVEKERSMMNPWTAEEKDIFIEKLAAFGKDFRKIASFLDHKTVADCIEFYYKNHKSECFEKTRKDSGFVKQRKSHAPTYLVASGKRRNPELNSASLDILGAVSEIVAELDAPSSCTAPRIVVDHHPLKESDNMDMDEDERETEAADVLAGICHSLSSEAMSSSITSSVDLGGGFRDPSCLRMNPTKQPLSPEFIQDVDVECSSELNPTDWSDGEKSIFIQAVSSYGKNFAMVSQSVGTKSMDQCKVFFSKARKCLGLDRIQHVTGTASDDDDDGGGGNEIEDGCIIECMKLKHESDMENIGSDCKSNRQGPLDSMIAERVSEFRERDRTDISNADENQCQGPLLPEEDDLASVCTQADKKSDNTSNGTCSTEGSRVSSLLKNASGTWTQFTEKESRNHNPSLPNDASRMDDGGTHSHNSFSTSCSTEILQGYPVSLHTKVGEANGERLKDFLPHTIFVVRTVTILFSKRAQVGLHMIIRFLNFKDGCIVVCLGQLLVGGPRAVRADEVIKFVNDLLSELAFKPYRNTLKMPALVLDKQVRMSRFISNNGLVEDPCVVEKERSMMNPWTAEEKDIFIEKLAAFGKDFRKIASFLDHKTVSDCIEFYYKNHKSECFEKTRKDSGFMKQRKSHTPTYLVASGKRRNPELNSVSLDILGAVSEIVAELDASSSCAAPRIVVDHPLKESDNMDMDNDERETEAADVLAGICHSLSSEAMSSSITSSVDLGCGFRDPSCLRMNPTKQPLSPEFTQDVDVECSSELNPTDWSDGEKSIFIQAVSSYGKNFAMVSQSVGTKSMDQCKVFFSKARKCLGLDRIQHVTGTASDDDDDGGGGNEIEDGCIIECMKLKHESDMENIGSDCKSNRQGPLDSMIAERVSEFRERDRTDISNADENQCQGPLLPEEDDLASVCTQADKKSDNTSNGTCSTEGSRVSSLLKNASGTWTQFTEKESRNHNPSLPNDASRMDDGGTHSHNSFSTSCSTEILQGYPVSLHTKVGEANGERLKDFLPHKCKETRQSNVERIRDHHHSRLLQPGCSSAGENLPKMGDVKLFGKILSSSPCNSADDVDLKLSYDRVQQPRFWDGNRIPDSARLLAKYPDAFSNFPLHGGVKNERDEMQRRNVYNNVSSQRGISGLHGGVLFGGQFSEMHNYAKAEHEQLRMQGDEQQR